MSARMRFVLGVLAAAALQTGASLPRDVARQVFALQLATLRATQGRMAELAGLFEALAAELPDHPTLPIALAGVYCEQGRLDEARKAIASVAADDFAAIESHQETWINCVIGLAQVAASLDDRDMAARGRRASHRRRERGEVAAHRAEEPAG